MDAVQLIMDHEGFRPVVYCDRCGSPVAPCGSYPGRWRCFVNCPGGNLTVGFGTRVDGAGIDKHEAQMMLLAVTGKNRAQLKRRGTFCLLDAVRQAAIEDIAYNCGVEGAMGFDRMWAALKDRNWYGAKQEVLDSDFGRENRNRARADAEMLLTGQWPESNG